jgi:hypothetical protein
MSHPHYDNLKGVTMCFITDKEIIVKIKMVCKQLLEVESIISSGKLSLTSILEYQREEAYLNQLLEDLVKCNH